MNYDDNLFLCSRATKNTFEIFQSKRKMNQPSITLPVSNLMKSNSDITIGKNKGRGDCVITAYF